MNLFKKLIMFVSNIVPRMVSGKSFRIGKDSEVMLFKVHRQQKCMLEVGDRSIVSARISFDRSCATVIIGSRTFVGNSAIVCADRVVIGDDVMVSWGCTIVDHDSHSIYWTDRKKDVVNWRKGRKVWKAVKISQVIIEQKAWIGFNSIILKGVTIGEGAVVGAGSVVTKNVAAYTVVAGNPARTIRSISEEYQ